MALPVSNKKDEVKLTDGRLARFDPDILQGGNP
jgi:hypothetical protein